MNGWEDIEWHKTHFYHLFNPVSIRANRKDGFVIVDDPSNIAAPGQLEDGLANRYFDYNTSRFIHLPVDEMNENVVISLHNTIIAESQNETRKPSDVVMLMTRLNILITLTVTMDPP